MREKGKTMSDYIKREDAIKAFDPSQRRDWYTPWIVEILEDLPSADVVPMERYKSMENTCVKLQKSLADVAPVRHGHWIKITPSGIYECSKCGKYVMSCDIEEYKYCQGCGARMDGEINE